MRGENLDRENKTIASPQSLPPIPPPIGRPPWRRLPHPHPLSILVRPSLSSLLVPGSEAVKGGQNRGGASVGGGAIRGSGGRRCDLGQQKQRWEEAPRKGQWSRRSNRCGVAVRGGGEQRAALMAGQEHHPQLHGGVGWVAADSGSEGSEMQLGDQDDNGVDDGKP
jgi:hypothetical protein